MPEATINGHSKVSKMYGIPGNPFTQYISNGDRYLVINVSPRRDPRESDASFKLKFVLGTKAEDLTTYSVSIVEFKSKEDANSVNGSPYITHPIIELRHDKSKTIEEELDHLLRMQLLVLLSGKLLRIDEYLQVDQNGDLKPKYEVESKEDRGMFSYIHLRA